MRQRHAITTSLGMTGTGCDGRDSNPRFPAYEAGDLAASLPRNIKCEFTAPTGLYPNFPLSEAKVGTSRLYPLESASKDRCWALLSQEVNPLIIKSPSSLTLDNRFARLINTAIGKLIWYSVRDLNPVLPT